MTRTHERKNSFFKEPETIFPWGKTQQLLAQTWNLLCFPRYFWEFLTHTYIFSSLTFSIFNQIVFNCTQQKHHAKPFALKYIQQRKFLCTLKILEKVKPRTSETLKAKIALPHREKWKISLTGKKSFCKEVEEIFSLD